MKIGAVNVLLFSIFLPVSRVWSLFCSSCVKLYLCVWVEYLITVVVQQELLSSGSEHWATFHRDDATPWSPLIGWNEGGPWSPQTVWVGCRRCTRHPRRSGARVGWAGWCALACCSYSALDRWRQWQIGPWILGFLTDTSLTTRHFYFNHMLWLFKTNERNYSYNMEYWKLQYRAAI